MVVVGHNDLDVVVLLVWDWLRLDAWLHFAINEILNEFANVLGCEFLFLIKRELLVLGSLLNRKGGPFIGDKVKIPGMSAKGFGVNCREGQDALVLFCNGLEGFGQFSSFLWGFCEDVGERETSLDELSATVFLERGRLIITYGHVASVCIWADLTNQRDANGFHKLCDSLPIELVRESVLTLVKGFV